MLQHGRTKQSLNGMRLLRVARNDIHIQMTSKSPFLFKAEQVKRDVRLAIPFLFLIVCILSQSWAQGTSRIPSYYSNVDFLLSTPGASGTAIGGYVNPALYRMLPGFETQFFWSDNGAEWSSLRDWGLFTGISRLGFGLVHRKLNLPIQNKDLEFGITDYRISLAEGSKSMSFGLGYGWSSGYPDTHPRDNILQLGTIQRPNRYCSIGISGTFSLGSSHRQGVFDLAVRPFGNSTVTLFGDAEIGKKDRLYRRYAIFSRYRKIRGKRRCTCS